MKISVFFILTIQLCCTYATRYPHFDTYHLTSGTYKAQTVEVFEKKIHKLIGLPYAQTPQIFRKSQLFNATTNTTKETKKWPDMCVQILLFNFNMYGNFILPHDVETSFSCLEINLYIPYPNEFDTKPRNLSAMLFIHGGSNAGGTSAYMDGSALAGFGNVIVATVNFRLDVLGFFNLIERGEYLSGNYGLWDQANAIKWLHQNCPNLGCDPNSITLFGHSAGSGDVLFQALSKHSGPLIKRVIMQSGSGLAHWALNYEKHWLKLSPDYRTSESGVAQKLYKGTRYIHSLNDTLLNYLCVTSCSMTEKNACLKLKLDKFAEM